MADIPGGAQGARCAIHAAALADRICERCGNFMCSECSEGGIKNICPACAGLVSAGEFPLRRDTWNFGLLWDYAWSAFKREWLMLSVAVLILGMIAAVISVIAQVVQGAVGAVGAEGGKNIAAVVIAFVVTTVIGQLAQGLIEMGLFRVYFDVLNGQKADIGRMFTQFSKAGTFIAQRLLLYAFIGIPVVVYFAIVAGIAVAAGGAIDLNNPTQALEHLGDHPAVLGVIGLGFLVMFVPLFYFLLPFYFATMEIVFNDGVGALESLGNCYTIAKGNRLAIFGVGFMAGLVTMAGAFLCCIGLLPSAALGQLLLTGLYLALRNGSGLPHPSRQGVPQAA